ncbi:MAG: hypothetical protein IKX40_02700 [Thermoguttaceae bacterium]|nr:hypothetical protein [Thermoguttaceae bacterium]
MKYVLQIKESIFPRLKANQYYFLGDIDETILYGSVPLFERLLKPGSEFIGFFLFDTLTQTEQANVFSKVEKSKNHPEFLQYQLLRVVESLKQPPTVSAQTETAPAESEQPPKTSESRKQRNHRVKDKDLQKARELIEKNPALTNKDICAILGVNENCAGFNPDGTKKILRVVIDNARGAMIGNYYLTGEEQDRAADAFFEDNATSKFEHKRRNDNDD